MKRDVYDTGRELLGHFENPATFTKGLKELNKT